VLGTFLDSLQKGDVDAAKAVSQIEPGAEEYFGTYTNLIIEGGKFIAALREKFGDEIAKLGPLPDFATAAKNAKITVKGEEALMADAPGQPPHKRFARSDGQWKLYFGAPDDTEKAQMAMASKLIPVFTTLTTDIQAGKYATLQDVQAAVQQAMQAALGGAPAPTPAPAP
jgi:hypothetical protein